jgi:hypothetical protein
MEQYVGLDVSLEQTSICVVDGSGKALWQGKCASTPEALAAVIPQSRPEWCASDWRSVRCRAGTGMS